MAENDAMTIEELEKQISALEAKVVEKMGAKGGLHYPESDDNDMTGSGKDNTKGHGKRVRMHKAKKKPMVDDSADDGDPEPDADDDGSGDDWSDKGAKAKAKKAAPEDEPAADLAKLEGESVVIEGQRIYKSAVGEGSFAILKGQADRLAKAESDIAKERDLRVTAEFQKRADEMYAHVPGTTEARGDMLKALALMPEAVRKSFEEVLIAHEKMAKSAFDRVGINPLDIDKLQKTAATFTAKIAEIKKRDNCNGQEAMQKARHEDPDGFKAYQQVN